MKWAMVQIRRWQREEWGLNVKRKRGKSGISKNPLDFSGGCGKSYLRLVKMGHFQRGKWQGGKC
jgi:hypothetical protein